MYSTVYTGTVHYEGIVQYNTGTVDYEGIVQYNTGTVHGATKLYKKQQLERVYKEMVLCLLFLLIF